LVWVKYLTYLVHVAQSTVSKALAGNVALMEEMRNACSLFVRKPEGKRPHGRPRRRWEDNIRIDLREIGMVWTGFVWLRIANSGGLFVKVKLFLCLTKHHAMKTYWGIGSIAPCIFNLGTGWR
jgi:hypothetical protein